LRLSPGELDDLAAQAATRQGVVRFRAELWGTSMAPLVGHGDRVVIETALLAELVPGEVAVYRNAEGRLVAHRLIEVVAGPDGPEARMQAKDPASAIERVPAERVLGRVISVDRAGPFPRCFYRISRLFRRLGGALRRHRPDRSLIHRQV
jgi:hypothetical protein